MAIPLVPLAILGGAGVAANELRKAGQRKEINRIVDAAIQIIESENKNPILRNTRYTKFTETKNTLEKRWILTM